MRQEKQPHFSSDAYMRRKSPFSIIGPGGDLQNSVRPSAAYMRQWIESALVQIMACRLFGTKLLSKPMLVYCQLGPYEQTSVKV